MKLSQQLTTAVSQVAVLEDQNEQLSAKVRQLRGAVEGNVLLVLCSGFSRPMFIHPTYDSWRGPDLPPYIESFEHVPSSRRIEEGLDTNCVYATTPYKRLQFRNTGRDDGFGRRIFEQIN